LRDLTKLSKRTTLILLAFLVSVQLLAIASYWKDQRYLEGLLIRISTAGSPPSEQVKQVLSFLRSKPSDTNSSSFLLPILAPLRPTARQVAERGGDCADRSRLLVVLLDLRHIPASKWALYSQDGVPRHAVVEVETEQGKMVADPLFGLWYPRPKGGYYGIEDLRKNPLLFQDHILELRGRHENPGTERLDWYPLNLYTYTYARTINWDKSASMRLSYLALHALIGQRVDLIHRPEWAEQPALMLVFGLGVAEGGLLFVWIVGAGWHRRRVRIPAQRAAPKSAPSGRSPVAARPQ
jgi:hypothetical protein